MKNENLKKLILFSTLAALIFSLGGCVTKGTYLAMEEEATSLEQNLMDLQRQYDDLSQENAALKEQVDQLNQSLAAQKEENENVLAEKQNLENLMRERTDNFSKTIAALRTNMEELKTDNASLVNDLQNNIANLETENLGLGEKIIALELEKEEKVQQLSSTYEHLLSEMKNEISRGEITISELKGKLTVNMVDSILFDSGKAEVKQEGLAVLQRVVDILKNITDKAIRVEGHTDNVPISGGLAQKYPTNWELSAARAINVTRFLQLQGIDPANLASIAYGEFKPVADNNSEEGKAKNRRIEIVLVAKE